MEVKDPPSKGRPIIRGAALISGTLGATASCFGKFSFDPNSSVALRVHGWFQGEYLPIAGEYVVRGICLVLMILCNAAMLGSFLSGMEESGSVAGTALSSAANFLASAFYGYLLFEEQFTRQWWFGLMLIVLGVFLLSSSGGTRGDGSTLQKPPEKTNKED